MKLATVLVMGLFLISLTSALEFDNFKYDDVWESGDFNLSSRNLKYNDIWERYKPIEIKNSFGFGDTLFKGAIVSHTEVCGSTCESIIEIEHSGGVLVQDIRFIGGSLVDYTLQVSNNYDIILEDDYATVCDVVGRYKNNSDILECNSQKVGKISVKKPIWQSISINDVLNAGDYKLRITGKKTNPSLVTDWQMKIHGEWLTEWALWTGSDAPVVYYKLDEASGNAIDAGGFINLIETGTVASAIGKINNSRGPYSTVNFLNNTGVFGINESVDYTFNFWVNRTASIATNQDIILLGGINTNDYTVRARYNSDNNIQIEIAKEGIAVLLSNKSTGITQLNNFTIVTLTHNSTDREVKLYMDGVLDRTGIAASNTFNVVSDFKLGFGFQALTEAIIDEVGLWNRTLEASDVTELFNSGAGQPFQDPTGFDIVLGTPDNLDFFKSQTSVNINATITNNSVGDIANVTLFTNISGGGTVSNFVDLAALNVSNFNFTFDLAVSTITSDINWQIQVYAKNGNITTSTNRTLLFNTISLFACEQGNSSSYLQLLFKDENNQSDLNASIPSSSWGFWIDDESQASNFSYNNATEASESNFCFNPDTVTFNVDTQLQYISTGYPQRIFTQDGISLSPGLINVTLYLLADADGFFTSYQAINSLTGSAISGVAVTVQKEILGIPTTVTQGITDDTGLLILWLDPDDSHSFTFTKAGFGVTAFNIFPASPNVYQIAMIPSGATDENGNGTEIVVGLTYNIEPQILSLQQDTVHTFLFNVSRTVAPTLITMNLTLSNGTNIFSDDLAGNGIISTSINTSSFTGIFGAYTIETINETLFLDRAWTISNVTSGNYSLDAWIKFGNELSFGSRWWGLFRYIFIILTLVGLAGSFYYLDPFDSAISSQAASVGIIWLFGYFEWLVIDTPLGANIDQWIIPALYSILAISWIIWRYKSQ